MRSRPSPKFDDSAWVGAALSEICSITKPRRKRRGRPPKKPRNADADDEYTQSPDDGYNEKLATIAREIKMAAEGRVCGGCRHHRDGWCAEKQNVNGTPLQILYPSAVACGQHDAIEEA